jgi:hypothetical protein
MSHESGGSTNYDVTKNKASRVLKKETTGQADNAMPLVGSGGETNYDVGKNGTNLETGLRKYDGKSAIGADTNFDVHRHWIDKTHMAPLKKDEADQE